MDVEKIDGLICDLESTFQNIMSDDKSREAGLWQGPMIPRALGKLGELKSEVGNLQRELRDARNEITRLQAALCCHENDGDGE